MKQKNNTKLNIRYDETNFYQIFSEINNEDEIKRIFSSEELTKPIDSRILVCAILGAAENKQEHYIPLVIEAANNLGIEITDIDSKIIFNCLVNQKSTELINQLIDKLSIIEKTFIEDRYIRVQINGKLEYFGSLPTSTNFFESKKIRYLANPLLFALEKSNIEVADLLLSKSTLINPSVINCAFIESCAENNIDAAWYLIENPKTKKIISNSTIIKTFLKEKTEFSAIKQEALAALEMRELKDELPIKNIVERKLKM